MERPKLAFPRLRFAARRATNIATDPIILRPWVTVMQNPRTSGAWFAGTEAVIFSGGIAVSVEMHNTGDP
jgi:hypothetical protein